MHNTAPKFLFGQTVITPNALSKLTNGDILPALARHVIGDWGELDPEDKQANDKALIEGTRLLSAYSSSQNLTFWIITEWDRSVTTILMPEDY
jgi:hypothetical protein